MEQIVRNIVMLFMKEIKIVFKQSFFIYFNLFSYTYLGDYMNFDIGDLVTRKSYNNDIVFKITDIIDNVYYLKGASVRLCADSFKDDLVKFESVDEEDKEFEERVKPNVDLNRDDYFYIPGKILHIDSDILLNNDLKNPYKIRKNANYESDEKSQKRQKIG